MTPDGIRNTRKQIHAIMGALSNCEESSRPLSSAYTAAEKARMWLGEALAETGAVNPYPDSLNPENENIADQADTAEQEFTPGDGSHIKFVKELRAHLVEITERCRQEIVTGSRKQFYRVAVSQAYVELCNARMWLGAELNRIHEADHEESPG